MVVEETKMERGRPLCSPACRQLLWYKTLRATAGQNSLPQSREEAARKALKRAARGKVEFIGAMGDAKLPNADAVQVDGATIFTFDVDSCEEF